MKFFHISDLHLGKKVNGFSMIEDQKHILKEIFKQIDEHKPDVLLIPGDIYDKVIPSNEAIGLFNEFLTGLANRNLTTIISSGNHDSAEKLAFASTLIKTHNIYISPVFENKIEPICLEDEYGEIFVYMLPFIKPIQVKRYYPDLKIETYNDGVKAVIDDLKINKSKRNIILVHQFVVGTKGEAEASESEENYVGAVGNVSVSLFDDFDYLAMGHLHKPQKIHRETARYSGSILKYSFSEAKDKKSIVMFEMKEKDTEIKMDLLDLVPMRDMHEIKGRYRELMEKSFYKSLNTDDYFHISLTDEEEIPNVLSRLRTVYPNIMKLDYQNKRTQKNMDVQVDMDIENKTPMEIIGDFYAFRNNQDLDERQREFLQELIKEVWG